MSEQAPVLVTLSLLTTFCLVVSSSVWITYSLFLFRELSTSSERIFPYFCKDRHNLVLLREKKKNGGEIVSNRSQTERAKLYLIGLSDQLTDIYADVRCFIIIAYWSLLHCRGQWAVFVCHTVKKPGTTPTDKEGEYYLQCNNI